MSGTFPNTSEYTHRFIVGGQAMRDIHASITKFAFHANTVLLAGETGVGKDLIAREIHTISPRSDKPFIQVSLSAISETILESELFGHEKGSFTGAEREKHGIFEAADGGTLYFPEISDLPEHIQLKLLQFLQYRTFRRVGHDPKKPEIRVDVTMIFASNADPAEAARLGKIRSDFYYRINRHSVHIPPLRRRPDEIGPLSEYFAQIYVGKFYRKEARVPAATVRMLRQYHWPGNVRELEGVIERAVLEHMEAASAEDGILVLLPGHVEAYLSYRKGDSLSLFENVFPEMNFLPDNGTILMECDKAYLTELLYRTGGKHREAASVAGFSIKTLRRKIKKLGIQYRPGNDRRI